MRRGVVSFGLSAALMIGAGGIANAATPSKDCPTGPNSGEWQSYAINWDWQPGDSVPGAGDEWWTLTLSGFAAEGLETPEEAAADQGFGSVEELYEAIVLGIRGLDKNGDGRVCAKPYKEQHWLPAYYFNAVDNNAREH